MVGANLLFMRLITLKYGFTGNTGPKQLDMENVLHELVKVAHECINVSGLCGLSNDQMNFVAVGLILEGEAKIA